MPGRRCFPAVVGARPDRQQLEAHRPPAGAARRNYDYRNLSNERHGLNYYKIQAFRLPESRKKLCNGNDLKLSKTTPAVVRRYNENGRRNAGRGITWEESVG
ncbi:hypothetical protein, partial [Pseudomonas aeruginosa]